MNRRVKIDFIHRYSFFLHSPFSPQYSVIASDELCTAVEVVLQTLDRSHCESTKPKQVLTAVPRVQLNWSTFDPIPVYENSSNTVE